MKSQFEAIIEGQKKAMSFWSDMAEQMKGAFVDEAKTETTEADLFNEWYQKQQSFFKEFTNISDPEKAFKKTPEQIQKWMEWQTAYAEKWLKFYQNNAEKLGWKLPDLNGMGSPKEYVEKTFQQWKDWLGGGNQFMHDQIMEKLPFNMQPHFKNFLDSYQHIHRYWEPIQKMIQNDIYDQHIVEKYFSADAYHKLVNQIMGYKAVGNVSEAIENVNDWFEKARAGFKGEWGAWSDVSENWRKTLTEQAEKGELPYFELASDLSSRMRDHLVPFENIMAQGRETEIMKLMRDLQFGYVSFLLKSTELQSQVYESGGFALPDTIREFAHQYQESKEAPDFQSFFNAYVNKLEETILEVLHSNDYSKLQADVSLVGTRVKSMYEKLMELWFSDVPFLTRTDGDDIAKETNALRKKVRTLESRLAALEKQLAEKTSPKAITVKEPSPKKKLINKIGTAKASEKDDLKLIKGIGPKLEEMLNELGIYTFEQISRLTDTEYELIDELLVIFQGRSKRDNWAKQAQELLVTTA